jgi:hypothetical protein
MKTSQQSSPRSEFENQQALQASSPSVPVRVLFSGRVRSAAVTRWAMARIHRTLHRFQRRIANVLVRIHDVNGHRGGLDQQCSLEIRLVDGQHLYLSDLAETPRRGIARLLQRSRRLLDERRKRRR